MNIILHSDLNNFYASVECLNKPELKNKPVVVGGSQQDRHGVVLAKNQTAKLLGIKTGMTIQQAKAICPNLIFFLPNFQKYVSYSKRVKNIYKKFTDKLESFGIDECWLDITNSIKLFGSPIEIAKKIQESVFLETGLTVSIGISYNKAFSKLGSDLKKPNGITIITPENYQNLVWPRPIQDLLGVGKQTALKLNQMGIHTIGELAKTNIDLLKNKLGKNGVFLHQKANGNDSDCVECNNICKSIGNSLTYYKDIKTFEEAKSLLILLAESVAARLIEENLGYAFSYEGINYLYLNSDDDEEFLNISVPGIYEVDEENATTYLAVCEKINSLRKYVKAYTFGDSLWIFYERALIGDENLEEVIRHMILHLAAALVFAHDVKEKIENGDSDDNND